MVGCLLFSRMNLTHTIPSHSTMEAPGLEWMAVGSTQTQARKQDITLADPSIMDGNDLHNASNLMTDGDSEDGRRLSSISNIHHQEDTFGGDEWQAFDPEGDDEEENMMANTSSISDIEQARDAAAISSSRLSILESVNEQTNEKMDMDEPQGFPMDDVDPFEPDYSLPHDNDNEQNHSMEGDNNDLNHSIEQDENNMSSEPDFGITAPSPVASISSQHPRLSSSSPFHGNSSSIMNLEDDDIQVATVTKKKRKRRKISRDEATELSSHVIKKVRTH